jgi:hypothetical protein
MAKKRTSKSKSGISKKHGFFTKRKVLLGIAIIALAGVGIVWYSNAAVGDPPVEKTLFCNQGHCFETQVEGSLRAPNKALVRETNRQECSATGKEWILKSQASRKQAANTAWVCLEGNSATTPPPTVPTGFEALGTDCFDTVMPTGTTDQPNLIQIPGGESNCLQIWTYQLPTGSSPTAPTVQGQFEVQPMILGGENATREEFVAAILAQPNTTQVSRNDDYELDGIQSTKLKIRRGENKILVIVSPKRQTINGTNVSGLVLSAREHGDNTDTGRVVRDTTDQILANWQWTE